MRPSFALRALSLSLAIGLSAFSLSGHAAIQFNCSDSLTREVGDALVLRCSGVLDVRGDGASDPDSVLSNANGISLHGELGLNLDKLTLVAPSIDLSIGQGRLQLGLDAAMRGGDVRIITGQGGTRPDTGPNLIVGSLLINSGASVADASGGPGGGIITLTENNRLPPLPQVGQVSEPGTLALSLVAMGALSLRLRG